MRRLSLLCAGLSLTLACEPSPKAPVKVMVLVPAKDGYQTAQVELRTITDLVNMEGEAAKLIGGVRLLLDPQEFPSTPLTDAQLETLLIKDPGLPPRANFVERTTGKTVVYVPADFHSWNMATTYFNFERAYDYFFDLQVVPKTELTGSKVFYFPSFTFLEIGPNPLTDNALFFSVVQAFAILPFEELQLLPLSMNPGVVAHEFSHRVWNKRVYKGQAVPEPLSSEPIGWLNLGASTPAVNILKGLDEGLADFHAFGVTCQSPSGCDPRFMRPSLGDLASRSRDISVEDRCMDAGLRTAINGMTVTQFTNAGLHYTLGTLVAGALYQAGGGSLATLKELQAAVLRTYSDESSTTPGFQQLIYRNLDAPENFSLATALNSLVQHAPDSARLALCNQLVNHLQMTFGAGNDLTACPPTTTTGTCPNIN